MQTTLEIDEDVFVYAKDIASRRGVSAGKVVSELARAAIVNPKPFEIKDGLPLLPVRPGGEMVTPELVNKLKDEE